jgi:hypothetical protein
MKILYYIHDVSVSFTTVCKGGFTRSSSSTTSDPRSSFTRFLFAIDSVTHSPTIFLLLDSTSVQSGREGDNGSSQGCSRRALNVGLFLGILFKLQN